MPLETATYVTSLVVTNPDGSDSKSTADDHIRLIKACLKRSFPQVDGAVSLSSAQLMFMADVSASVQFQLNTLRDGSATANNAINAQFANSASVANNALSLGGHAAALYLRSNAAVSLSARFVVMPSAASPNECIRLAGGNDDLISWTDAAQVTTLGFIQMDNGGSMNIFNAQTGEDIRLLTTSGNVTINDNTAWHAGNDGSGSGLDADTVDGYNASETAANSTIAARTSNGYLFATYFNQSSSESENPNVVSVFVSNGDGYLRKATPAYLGSAMVTRNISSKSGTAKTISAVAPSGGADGDIHYQIVS